MYNNHTSDLWQLSCVMWCATNILANSINFAPSDLKMLQLCSFKKSKIEFYRRTFLSLTWNWLTFVIQGSAWGLCLLSSYNFTNTLSSSATNNNRQMGAITRDFNLWMRNVEFQWQAIARTFISKLKDWWIQPNSFKLKRCPALVPVWCSRQSI